MNRHRAIYFGLNLLYFQQRVGEKCVDPFFQVNHQSCPLPEVIDNKVDYSTKMHHSISKVDRGHRLYIFSAFSLGTLFKFFEEERLDQIFHSHYYTPLRALLPKILFHVKDDEKILENQILQK